MYKKYKNENLKEILYNSKGKVVIRGAGTLGKLAINALYSLDINVDYFWEEDPKKQGLKYSGIDVLNNDEIKKLGNNVNIFLASNYFSVIIPQLKKFGIKNVYEVYELVKNTNYRKIISSSNDEIHNFGEIKKFPFQSKTDRG